MQDDQQTVSPQARLISHAGDLPQDDATLLTAIKARLGQDPARPAADVERLLQLLDALWAVELGRFLLRNCGLDAYWTHQVVTHQPGSLAPDTTPALEYALFETLPAVLATRERFGIFRAQLQALLQPGMTLASVPCGWMGDLLSLDYRQCPEVQLLGIDLDPQALEGALQLARRHGLEGQLSLRLEDAWTQGDANSVDVLTSNGLNLYEPDDARVIALYGAFFHKLRPGGTLLTSFLTPPQPVRAVAMADGIDRPGGAGTAEPDLRRHRAGALGIVPYTRANACATGERGLYRHPFHRGSRQPLSHRHRAQACPRLSGAAAGLHACGTDGRGLVRGAGVGRCAAARPMQSMRGGGLGRVAGSAGRRSRPWWRWRLLVAAGALVNRAAGDAAGGGGNAGPDGRPFAPVHGHGIAPTGAGPPCCSHARRRGQRLYRYLPT
ncbi:hypothetical protein FHR61_003647 [Xanthomonas arboricola]|uniref:Methyltransferase domain-containing protein n=1 Tax=Xanthomonas cannabis TaxID=1885674 RepID=A0ABR6JQ50_9XANT|nr:hypothetical protein [Xanthomonas cannabis]MBB5523767.1 hypothetical protein [Xanthomonas cannabis]